MEKVAKVNSTPPALYVCNNNACDCLLEKATKVNRPPVEAPVDLRYFFQEAVAPLTIAYVESGRSARVTMQ